MGGERPERLTPVSPLNRREGGCRELSAPRPPFPGVLRCAGWAQAGLGGGRRGRHPPLPDRCPVASGPLPLGRKGSCPTRRRLRGDAPPSWNRALKGPAVPGRGASPGKGTCRRWPLISQTPRPPPKPQRPRSTHTHTHPSEASGCRPHPPQLTVELRMMGTPSGVEDKAALCLDLSPIAP